MELHLPSRFPTFSSPTSCGSSPNFAFLCDFSRTRFPRGKSRRIATPLRTSSTSSGHTDRESRSACEDLWRDSDSVEVIGIGSRKDAVLDFCLESSFESTSLRFWTVHMRDSQKVQLLQRSLGKDTVLRNVEGLLSAQSYPRATILVASAGYSVDHVTALELLNVVKSAGGLAIAIVLKPFSFEGQRRQHEEAERDPQKKWSPIMEMQYRGGIYRGRCQGGLPEGKGRLTLTGGSFYDGMWRYGKRSGLGTFYYSNGDVFQGSWRDDLMHGKGWLYFHTGDRWFANFWKGKANGEGRFYSKLGNIFFGNFQDGWRHGHCLCIDIDGTRWAEIWDEGVLVSRNKLDAETETK